MEFLGGVCEKPTKQRLKDYDFKHIDSGHFYEVKRDRLAPETGNIAVELAFKGNPSGVTHTKADWMVYIIGESFYRISPKALLALTTDVRKVMGGDGWKSQLALVKLEDFKNEAELLI